MRYLFFMLLVAGTLSANNPQEQVYLKALEDQISHAEIRASEILSKMQFNPNLGKQFQQANRMVEVKKVLLKNLRNSPALKSPTVRRSLMEAMKKDVITADDLNGLQEHINAALNRFY